MAEVLPVPVEAYLLRAAGVHHRPQGKGHLLHGLPPGAGGHIPGDGHIGEDRVQLQLEVPADDLLQQRPRRVLAVHPRRKWVLIQDAYGVDAGHVVEPPGPVGGIADVEDAD